MGKKCETFLSLKLKEMRAKYGYNQEEVAQKIGMKRSNVTNYETGRNVPPADVLKSLAVVYHTSVDYLLGKTNNIEPYHAEHDLMSIGDLKYLRLMHNGVELSDDDKDAIIKMIENMLAFKLDKKG